MQPRVLNEGPPLQQLQQRLLHRKPDLHNSTDLLLRDRLTRAIEIAEGEAEQMIEGSEESTPSIPSERP